MSSRIEVEKKVVESMIKIYCKGLHKTKDLCLECSELCTYAQLRLDKCPQRLNKTFCGSCQIHCYKPDMKKRIKKVMRYSGPRIIFHHPVMAIQHLFSK